VILPLYEQEIHYIVRADSPLKLHPRIKNAKINGARPGQRGSLINATPFNRMMFNGPIPEANDSFLEKTRWSS